MRSFASLPFDDLPPRPGDSTSVAEAAEDGVATPTGTTARTGTTTAETETGTMTGEATGHDTMKGVPTGQGTTTGAVIVMTIDTTTDLATMIVAALALSPAVMIALVCEYQRGPMEEYFQGVRERERKRIMGEFDIEEEEAEAALAKLGRIPLEEESKKSFSDRVADSASILYTSAMGMITGDDGGSDSGDKEIDH